MPRGTHMRMAGAAYLFVILVGMLSVSLIDAKLVVAGDSSETASNIVAHELSFRVGIVAVLAMYAGVVVISAYLYAILRTVDETLARLAMLLRITEAIVGAATAVLSLVTLALLTDSAPTAALGVEQAQALAATFLDVRTAALDVVLFFVGLGGTLFCYLFYASRYVPRALAAWGSVAYLSMLVLAIISITFPGHPPALETALYANGAVFELVFGAWLLFKRFDGPGHVRGS